MSSQREKNLYRFLEFPGIYQISQQLFGHQPTELAFAKWFGCPSGLKILDVGCGTGIDAKKFQTASKYVGLDPNPDYIATAKKMYGNFGQFYNVSVSQIESLKLEQFDVIMMKGVIHHLKDDEIHNSLRIVSKLLSSTGKFISIDPVYIQRQRPLARFLVSLDRGTNVQSTKRYLSVSAKYFSKLDYQVISQTFPPYDRIIQVAWNQ